MDKKKKLRFVIGYNGKIMEHIPAHTCVLCGSWGGWQEGHPYWSGLHTPSTLQQYDPSSFFGHGDFGPFADFGLLNFGGIPQLHLKKHFVCLRMISEQEINKRKKKKNGIKHQLKLDSRRTHDEYKCYALWSWKYGCNLWKCYKTNATARRWDEKSNNIIPFFFFFFWDN